MLEQQLKELNQALGEFAPLMAYKDEKGAEKPLAESDKVVEIAGLALRIVAEASIIERILAPDNCPNSDEQVLEHFRSALLMIRLVKFTEEINKRLYQKEQDGGGSE